VFHVTILDDGTEIEAEILRTRHSFILIERNGTWLLPHSANMAKADMVEASALFKELNGRAADSATILALCVALARLDDSAALPSRINVCALRVVMQE